MKQNPRLSIIKDLMVEFADRTGLSTGGTAPRRYLWTDAFSVCNFLELYRQTRDERYMGLALLLVDQVHEVLGRHREDDPRTGWISGLDEPTGSLHPTMGGLRIGKKLNERRPSDPFNDRLEWDRDGQYYHYLTKWMHALNCATRATGDRAYSVWAIELAKTAHARFTYVPYPGGTKMMYWKMSIDLTRPLVSSMGHHDPLDGLVTYSELQATAAEDPKRSPDLDLSREIEDMVDMCKGRDWATDDPLGIGGLLSDACRVAQMVVKGVFHDTGLLETLLENSRHGLNDLARTKALRFPADYRLAFRELGLSIGLRAVSKMKHLIETEPDSFNKKQELQRLVEMLMQYTPLAETIENFWLEPTNRDVPSFTDHRDINIVMLATSLAPDGYLAL